MCSNPADRQGLASGGRGVKYLPYAAHYMRSYSPHLYVVSLVAGPANGD